jgi:hypothetical protein
MLRKEECVLRRAHVYLKLTGGKEAKSGVMKRQESYDWFAEGVW